MPFHQGAYSGAVAVSYSSSPMAPLSPSISRRYSGTSTSGTTTSRIGNSTSKYNTYRPEYRTSSSTASLLDRSNSSYSKPLGTSRISYVPSGRSYCSPSRSVSSSTYSDSSSIGTTGSSSSSRYLTPSSSSFSLSRDRNGISGTSVVDRLTSKYSSSLQSRCTSPWRSGSSTYLDLLGGDDSNSELRRDQSSSSSASSVSSSSSSVTSSRYSTLHKRKPPLSTVLTSSHAQNDSAKAPPAEVTVTDQRNNNNTHDQDHDADADRPTTSSSSSSCNNNSNNNHIINNNNDTDDNNLQRRDHEESDESLVGASDRGGGGLIDANLDPPTNLTNLTNLPTNLDNTELLTNNNARYREGKIVIEVVQADDDSSLRIIEQVTGRDNSEGIKSALGGNDPFADPFFTTNNTFVAGSGGILVENGVGERPTAGTHGDDPSLMPPSTSRRADQYSTSSVNSVNEAAAAANSLASSSGAGARQSNYRGASEQIEGSPTGRGSRNRHQAHRDERCGLNGLRNIGNTCFMNSVIQCLSNTRPLLEYLLNEHYLLDLNATSSSMKGALIKAFSQVIHELWEVGGDHVVNTTALKSQIQKFAPRFMGYSQQDAQEFLRYLLEGLHEDVNRVKTKPQPILTDIPDHYSDSQKATESWKRYLRSEDSTIVDDFVGQLRSSLRCTSCDHVSVTLDPFWDLSLPIPTRSGTVKLSQCLEHFTREEVLDGDEKPTCSKCQMRRKCTKSFSIQKFPKILVIRILFHHFSSSLSNLISEFQQLWNAEKKILLRLQDFQLK
ncbi:ubiquitin carboxyl-terminal hydrolase Usp2-like isoform X2 [Belonocnema kinseyi]|uniref:ubiquitin carboxyl-terminal hydrolase Usp2-like isoform X2 n=1 Tax=Belonocnema kinseyi TaxID=2817044 RepID=UPI00143D0F89|nr:ubiquitin carboxyl-terminal hydrolase Usp2-like isoform X2 [Belonocnema kinseyi]